MCSSDLHSVVKKHKIKIILRKEIIIKKIKKLGFKASETHFNPEAIRSTIPLEKLLKILRQ